MAQEQNQHLTTEQLSALLDKQLPAREQAFSEAHLRACQQCQTILNDLRQTVALLHALPQPTLPRSFVLSPEMLHAATPAAEPALAAPVTIQIDERRRQRQHGLGATPAQNRGQQRHYILPRTLRVMSTLVAVLGLLFVLSAIPLHTGGAASTASNGSSYGPHSSTTGGSASPTVRPHNQGVTPSVKTPIVVQPPTPVNRPRGTTNQPPSASSPAVAPTIAQWLSLFNPTATAGRAIDGLLLLILAAAGWLIARRWRVRQT